MPRKKIKSRAIRAIKKTEKEGNKNRFGWNDSYISLLIGLFVVIIGGFLVFFFARNQKPQIKHVSPLVTPTLSKEQKQNLLERHYKVREGDNLWIIAERFYKSGYNWVDIARMNKLAVPSDIHAGDNLVVPNVKPIIPTRTVETGEVGASSTKAIKGSSYTVEKGDYLWEIAIRAYGDGFKWVDIARVNNLANPDLIFSGNLLKIPR